MTSISRVARVPKLARRPRQASPPKAAREQPSLVFRDFVRQLEKLSIKPLRSGTR